jgi:hypothetical protein
MKVDWFSPDYQLSSFDDPSFPPPGGQYLVTVPLSLASLRLSAAIHIDQEDGTQYVHCEGQMLIPPFEPTDPDSYYPNYWPYQYTGWPVLAIIPGDIFNADVTDADPVYEGGGKYIESAMVAKFDNGEDWGAGTLWSYDKLGGAPFQMTDHPLGNVGRGGAGYGGVDSLDNIYAPPSGTVKDTWTYRAVSQQCWVLIVIDPASHRYIYDTNPYDPARPPFTGTGEPVVITNTTGLTRFKWSMMWKLGKGSGIPANDLIIPGGGGSGQSSPSTVDIQ